MLSSGLNDENCERGQGARKWLCKTSRRLSASRFLTVFYVLKVLPLVHLQQEQNLQSATRHFVSNLFSYAFGVFAATFFG
jgi:hypothetical protein